MIAFKSTSRFSTDSGFKVLTRKGITIGTFTIMPTPVRSAQDSLFLIPLRLAGRWDLVAEEMVGSPDDKWIVMRHNRIADPFLGPNAGDKLLIPTQEQVRYYRQQSS